MVDSLPIENTYNTQKALWKTGLLLERFGITSFNEQYFNIHTQSKQKLRYFLLGYNDSGYKKLGQFLTSQTLGEFLTQIHDIALINPYLELSSIKKLLLKEEYKYKHEQISDYNFTQFLRSILVKTNIISAQSQINSLRE